MLRPVDGSAMAGVSGRRSRRPMPAKAERRAPRLFARDASTSARAMRRLCRIGTSDRLSAPPAMPASAWPRRIAFATWAMASLAEAQARFTVRPGTPGGRPTRSAVSRPRLGAFTDGMTWPITTVPIQAGSASVRSRSSRTQAVARSRAVRSRNAVPALANGVRQPASTATLLSRLISVDLGRGDLPPPRRSVPQGTKPPGFKMWPYGLPGTPNDTRTPLVKQGSPVPRSLTSPPARPTLSM